MRASQKGVVLTVRNGDARGHRRRWREDLLSRRAHVRAATALSVGVQHCYLSGFQARRGVQLRLYEARCYLSFLPGSSWRIIFPLRGKASSSQMNRSLRGILREAPPTAMPPATRFAKKQQHKPVFSKGSEP